MAVEEIGAVPLWPKISALSKLTGPCFNDSCTWHARP